MHPADSAATHTEWEEVMKLYEWDFAPNCRRVRMFLLEKGIEIPKEECITPEIALKDPFISKYEHAMVPMLELNDGFQIFLPNVPQKIYHFTNYKYAFDAAFSFNPDHPTSLLYEKHGDDYKLVGVMYTAPKRFSETDLDQRIPLSIAQWHEHVNLCMPPEGRKQEALLANAKFGLRGSIATKEECDANGGTFRPLIFNWMVHLYPLEKNEADVWAVDRGHDHGHGD